MNILVTIESPQIANAIQALAIALAGKARTFPQQLELAFEYPQATTAPVQPAIQTVPAPIQQIPATNAPVQTIVQPPQVQATQQYAPPAAVPTQVVTQPGIDPAGQIPVALPVVPTTVQTYTAEQLGLAAVQLMDAGRSREELTTLLAQFGVQSLTALPKEYYGAYATQLRAMGARI